MLIIAKRLRELSFGGLMAVYGEENRENGRKSWPEEPEMRRIALAEAAFYNYLDQVFFHTPGAFYALWEERGQYVSALRLEPYRDGLLLEALETRPDQRRQGHGEKLVAAVLEQVGGKVYSHVKKGNLASLRLHEKCGFQPMADYAAYVDGSLDRSSVTLCRTGKGMVEK